MILVALSKMRVIASTKLLIRFRQETSELVCKQKAN